MKSESRIRESTAPNLVREWERVARELGLQIEVPFEVKLPSGRVIAAQILLRRFGGPIGILLFTEYEAVRGYGNALADLGYGLSVLSEPSDQEPFDINSSIEVLRDWGGGGRLRKCRVGCKTKLTERRTPIASDKPRPRRPEDRLSRRPHPPASGQQVLHGR